MRERNGNTKALRAQALCSTDSRPGRGLAWRRCIMQKDALDKRRAGQRVSTAHPWQHRLHQVHAAFNHDSPCWCSRGLTCSPHASQRIKTTTIAPAAGGHVAEQHKTMRVFGCAHGDALVGM